MMHHNVTLPEFLLPFMVTKFGYDSIYHKSYSGREYIRNNTEAPYHHFVIKSARLSRDEFHELYDFFHERKARLISFNLDTNALGIKDCASKKVRFVTSEIEYSFEKDGSYLIKEVVLSECLDNSLTNGIASEDYYAA